MEFDTVIRHGKIVTSSSTFAADIGIKNGVIETIGRSLPGGKKVIDADGCLVLPGGIDAHCHLDQPTTDGSVCADDFYSGSLAAAFGGTTTILPFACQFKGQRLSDVVADYHKKALGKAVVDYSFHLIISDPTTELINKDLPHFINQGHTSFKIYMTYDDLKLNDFQIISLLACAKEHGALPMVHAENSDLIKWLTNKLLDEGHWQPKFHADSRPMLIEREATHRAITIAELADVPILIVHVSGREAVEQIHHARGRGLNIYAETCPQYIVLTREDLVKPGFEGAKCICSPPPRDKSNQTVIWNNLRNGLFQIFSSDHAPFKYQSSTGKMLHGEETPFHWVPNGIPGIETRIPILFSEGVVKKRIDINRFVELVSTNPAKLYGLYPKKGTIAIGSDADIVIYDPNGKRVIKNENLHHNVDYTPFEGLEVTGWPITVLSRGVTVIEKEQFVGQKGYGQFIARSKTNLLND
jgi:dihydropyrimidinase